MTKFGALQMLHASVALGLTLLAPVLSGCNDHSAASPQRPAFVRTEIVRPRPCVARMYGPAVRGKKISTSWWRAVLHQCIRPLIGA
jgi:hypothetical protein